MPYTTTLPKLETPVKVNEGLLSIQGLNNLQFTGYATGGETTDRDAPRTSSGAGYGSGIDMSGVQNSGATTTPRTITAPSISQPETPSYSGITSTGLGSQIPKGADLIDPDKLGYISIYEVPTSSGGGGSSTGTPDKNGFIWTLPNGQGFPPTRSLLFSNNRRTLYYEDKDLTTKFQVIGKTIEQCSRVSNEVVGEFTGRYQFNSTDPFGKGYTLKSLEVKTKFPFNRLGEPVETEYTLWVDTFVRYFTDNVQSITTNTDGTLTYHYANGSTAVVSQNGTPLNSSGGYNTGGGTTTDKPASKSNTGLLLIGGLLLILISSNSK